MTQPDGPQPGAGPPPPRTALGERLRSVPVFAGELPGFDPTDVPADPVALFQAWLGQAIDAGVSEPHAMTVATVDPTGAPSSRVVILKDVRAGGWEFATDARSRKARDLDGNPLAAASFYWPAQGRQVRLTGPVRQLGAQASAADFLARSPASRAAALAVRPGEPLGSAAELEAALGAALRRVQREPELVLVEWLLLVLTPLELEFWQGRPSRAHVRLGYRRDRLGDPWRHTLRWP